MFSAPQGTGPLALNLASMGKGQAWVNGQSVGRYWPAYLSPLTGCTDNCDYRGSYDASKCQKDCGKPAQTLWDHWHIIFCFTCTCWSEARMAFLSHPLWRSVSLSDTKVSCPTLLDKSRRESPSSSRRDRRRSFESFRANTHRPRNMRSDIWSRSCSGWFLETEFRVHAERPSSSTLLWSWVAHYFDPLR